MKKAPNNSNRSRDLWGSQGIVTGAKEPSHEDAAIGSFLALLGKDIRTGQRLDVLPESLGKVMLATLNHPVDLDAEIAGDVVL